MNEQIIDGKQYKTLAVKTETTSLLLIQGDLGFLACAYINVDIANKLGEAVAIVTGVKSIEDVLNAPILDCSQKAYDLGIRKKMLGREALGFLSA